MRRRDFIAVISGAAAWPLVARAQQSVMPVVGILQPGSPEVYVHFMDALRRGLGESGYVEGKNVLIQPRWPRTDSDQLTELATELVNHHVAPPNEAVGSYSEVGLSSPIKADQNASDQKRAAKHGTDEIEVVTGTAWQAPPHAGKQMERFGDVGEGYDHQTSETQ